MFLYNKQGRLVRVAFCVQYAFADIKKSCYLWRVNI